MVVDICAVFLLKKAQVTSGYNEASCLERRADEDPRSGLWRLYPIPYAGP
jgi:hypothetical protein